MRIIEYDVSISFDKMWKSERRTFVLYDFVEGSGEGTRELDVKLTLKKTKQHGYVHKKAS